MPIAPDPILKAANDTVAWACVYIRNQTLREGTPTKLVNDMMEAIHAVPQMVTNWRDDALHDIRIQFGCFHPERWPGSPDLAAFFEQRLSQYSSST